MGLILSAVAAWLGLCAVFFLAVLVASGGELGTAAWHTAAWGLRALLLLGFVPLVESAATLRLPFILPVIGYFGLLVGLSLGIGEEEALALFAPVERSDPASLGGVAAQAAVAFPATSLLFVAATMAAARWRRGALEVVPTGHGGAPS